MKPVQLSKGRGKGHSRVVMTAIQERGHIQMCVVSNIQNTESPSVALVLLIPQVNQSVQVCTNVLNKTRLVKLIVKVFYN